MNSKLEGTVFPKINYAESKNYLDRIVHYYKTRIRKQYDGKWYLMTIWIEDETKDKESSINVFLDAVYRNLLFVNIKGLLELQERYEKDNNGRFMLELDEYQGSEEERLKIN